MKNIALYAIGLTLLMLSCNKKEMIIEELKIDTSKGNYTFNDTIHRKEHIVFILQNFCYCERDEIIIDSLVCSLIEDKTYGYGISFFKKSKNTSIEHLTQFPRDFDRYSRKDKLMGVTYDPYRKGKIIVRQNYIKKNSAITKIFKCEENSINYIKDSKLLK